MYDTIIIGAGLSGLAAGIRLAYYERPVCIVEKHTTIGGLNSFYRLRKRDHDVGLHAVTNYAKPGTKTGPLSKLLRQLRLRWEDFDLTPQCGSTVAFPGVTLRFTNEFSILEQQIAEAFPTQIDGFRRLVQRINEHDELNLAARETSAREIVCSEITDRTLVDMLFCPLMFYGSPTAHDMDFTQFVIMFKAVFQEGFGRPHEGVRLIMRKMVQQYRGFGGELRLRSGVQRILSDNGRVTGVQLENGMVLEAKHVVSSAGSAETMRLCDVEPAEPEPYRPGAISFLETIFSLDCMPSDLGHNETIVFYNDSDRFVYDSPHEPIDLRSGIICSPNNFQYDKPLDDGRVRITALANPDYWMTLPQDRYVAEKEAWTQRIVESALRFMPDFRSHVVDTDAFTPRTITKFTSHFNGAVYGAPHKIRSGQTHLQNLFLCGTDQGFLGIIGSMLSGITIANLHLLKAN